MKVDVVRWGIIGAGDVCEVKSGPAFYKIEHSELVAVMRRNAEKAADFAKRHGAKRWYTDVNALLSDAEINAIYVATPPSSHAEYAIRAMKAGKAVYVEKPMAMNFAECRRMVDVSNETKMPLFVAHYRKMLPYFLKIKELIDAGQIGKPLAVNVFFARPPLSSDLNHDQQTWRVDSSVAGGGYLFDLAPHVIDILDFLIGKMVKVAGFKTNQGGLYQPEDSVSASFVFETGAVGNALWEFVSASAATSDVVHVIGSNGHLWFSVFEFTPIELENATGKQSFVTEKPTHIQQPMIQTIVDELRGTGSSPCHGDVGARPNWFMDQLQWA
ncbi:MAG: Gfo/Idh/MocA family protein [Microbacter sp.]